MTEFVQQFDRSAVQSEAREANEEERVLESYGYRQQLKRDMGFFSSFAVSFSIISVTTGIFAVYGFGLRVAGPAFIWTWLFVGAGQLLVALVFARLAKRIPLSGYAYHWTRKLMSPTVAWWAGWLVIVQYLSGMPAVCYALANYVESFAGIPSTNRNVIIGTVGFLISIAVINHLGIHLASRVNNFSVAAEIMGTVVAGALLLVFAILWPIHDIHFLFSHPNFGSGAAYIRPLALASLMSIWTLTGFEGAANLAEETLAPQRHIPAAIVSSLLISIIFGFLVLVGFTLAIPSLAATEQQHAPLLYIMHSRLPSSLVTAVMLSVFVAIYASALANLTSVTRMVWAMARDRQLPASQWLGQVNLRRVPANAIWLVTCIAILFTCWVKVGSVMASISAQAGYATYAIVVWAECRVLPRIKNKEQTRCLVHFPTLFTLAALGWLLLVVTTLSMPQLGAVWTGDMALLCTALLGLVLFLSRSTSAIVATAPGTAPEVEPEKTGPA